MNLISVDGRVVPEYMRSLDPLGSPGVTDLVDQCSSAALQNDQQSDVEQTSSSLSKHRTCMINFVCLADRLSRHHSGTLPYGHLVNKAIFHWPVYNLRQSSFHETNLGNPVNVASFHGQLVTKLIGVPLYVKLAEHNTKMPGPKPKTSRHGAPKQF